MGAVDAPLITSIIGPGPKKSLPEGYPSFGISDGNMQPTKPGCRAAAGTVQCALLLAEREYVESRSQRKRCLSCVPRRHPGPETHGARAPGKLARRAERRTQVP
jgi:hypothetical protein